MYDPTPFEPFELHLPKQPTTPVVVEVPHAGLRIDPLAMATLTVPMRSVGRDADLHVDHLCRRVTETGAALIVGTQSRYVCDLNRGPRDFDAQAGDGGALLDAPHGLFWRKSTEGHDALAAPLSATEVARRLRVYYEPYHRQVQTLLEAAKREFGYAILLCAHSMPSCGRAGHTDQKTMRADIVPGSQGRTSAANQIIDLPATLASRRGWSVLHDEPYRGGFGTTFYGRPATRTHAVQVEINRALYLNEDTLALKPDGVSAVTDYFTELSQALAALPAAHL